MLDQFQSFITKHRIFREGDRLLLAISGGLDSVCLLFLLLEMKLKPALAHCNFQLRGGDADADEQFVRDLALKYKLNIYVKRFETVGYAESNAISIQMAARELRFGWFDELSRQHAFQKVLLAQHRDDQVETFFINLLRGSGLSGLKGMLPLSGIFARPLLFTGRDQIYDYAKKNQLKWREDQTNSETKYLRNHIRHKLLPALNQIDKQFLDKISESTNILASEESLLHYLEDQALESIVSCTNSVIRIAKEKLENVSQPQVLLYHFLKSYNFNITQVQDIVSCNQFGKRFYSSTHELLVERNFLEILTKTTEDVVPSEYVISENQNRLNKPIALEIKKLKCDEGFVLEKRSDLALLDFDCLKFPLKVRNWQEGDRFKPLGMRGSKLLSDFFIDNKFSELEKRNSFLLLNADNQIVWLVGHRIDDDFKITSHTKVIYRIELQ
ncbi:MAG: tRNA lysidine(34) synthetase TilS [Bacteroidales bacterium]|jgi:tRNA(Ile)-lysidine synthase|nr:tRNA lysidine(34) synthetase TilS [Bacteroidales bacterium]